MPVCVNSSTATAILRFFCMYLVSCLLLVHRAESASTAGGSRSSSSSTCSIRIVVLLSSQAAMQALQWEFSGLEASTSGRTSSVSRPHTFPVTRSRHIHQTCSCQAAAPRPAGPTKQPQKPKEQVIKTQQLTLPPSEFAKVRKAVYVSSSVDLKGCPPQSLPEFAVIGRSNVGKSSLINMLTQSNKLAKVSKNPGALGSRVCYTGVHVNNLDSTAVTAVHLLLLTQSLDPL